MGCDDGLRLELEPATGEFIKPGEIGILLDIGGAKAQVQCTISGSPGKSDCTRTGDESILPFVVVSLEYSSRFIWVQIRRAEPSIIVDVTRDGSGIGSKTYAPNYETFEPNGPECGPVCHSASDSWAVL